MPCRSSNLVGLGSLLARLLFPTIASLHRSLSPCCLHCFFFFPLPRPQTDRNQRTSSKQTDSTFVYEHESSKDFTLIDTAKPQAQRRRTVSTFSFPLSPLSPLLPFSFPFPFPFLPLLLHIKTKSCHRATVCLLRVAAWPKPCVSASKHFFLCFVTPAHGLCPRLFSCTHCRISP